MLDQGFDDEYPPATRREVCLQLLQIGQENPAESTGIYLRLFNQPARRFDPADYTLLMQTCFDRLLTIEKSSPAGAGLREGPGPACCPGRQ